MGDGDGNNYYIHPIITSLEIMAYFYHLLSSQGKDTRLRHSGIHASLCTVWSHVLSRLEIHIPEFPPTRSLARPSAHTYQKFSICVAWSWRSQKGLVRVELYAGLAICQPAKFKKNTTMCSLMQLAKIFICVFCMWCMVSMCLFNHVIHSTVQVCAIFQATGTSQSFYTCTGL